MTAPKVYPVFLTISQINDLIALVNEKRVNDKNLPPEAIKRLEELKDDMENRLYYIGFLGH